MDKLAVIRSVHTEEIDHPEATHYAITGHKPNPAMQFPSIGSILAKEMGPRNGLPPYVKTPKNQHPMVDEYFKAAFIGAEYNPMLTPDPSKKDFQIADLSLLQLVPASAQRVLIVGYGVGDIAGAIRERQAEWAAQMQRERERGAWKRPGA